jgi:predicted dehydrogenase
VATENSVCADVSCEILEKGISVINEKPMAINYADAKRMADAAEKNGAHIITNWPIAWFPAFNYAKKLADEGRVGKIMRVVYRSPATWGPYSYGKEGVIPPIEWLNRTWWYRKECGGGSILDYACYGTILATHFFGKKALKVSGIAKQFGTVGSSVEDYSAMILDFGDGVGLLEGSWSSYNPAEIPSGPIIYGMDGVIVCDRHSTVVKIYEGNTHAPKPPVEVIECADMTEFKGDLGRNIIDFLQGKAELNPLLGVDINLAVCAALDAGRKSAEQGITADVE